MRFTLLPLLGVLLACSSALHAQQLQFTAFAGMSPAAEISFVQTAPEATLQSKSSPVFEIGLDYYQKIYRRWGLVAGVYAGVQSHSTRVEVTPAFLGTEWAPDHRDRSFAYPHVGARLLADYRLLEKNRHQFSVAAGIGAYRISDYYLTNEVYVTPVGEPFQGNDRVYYTSLTLSDNSKAIRFRPEFRLNWQYAFGEKMALKVFVAGAYSNFAFQNTSFNLIGANALASGNWLTRFQQTGIGLGISRRW